ncbi:hypothetical protein DL765_004119 [Monosporascus sp. GIB2]|nr:hypothetical protein DL765_004119 [Monosporascus sp. GIB2]
MSSSTLSTSNGNAPAPRVPAWKRLGLKLKPASGESHTSTAAAADAAVAPLASAPVPQKREQVNGSAGEKRKPSGALKSDHSVKKARRDFPEVQTPTPSRKTKSVTFAAEVTGSPTPAAANRTQAAVSKKPKQPAKTKSAAGAGVAATPAVAAAKPSKAPGKHGPVNLEPALAYLRQWHTSRDSWKFNKNHQTRLLEQVFADETTIPAVDIGIFYAYIRGLKGGVRARLRELARGIRARDMEQGTDGFSATAGNNGNNKKNDKEVAAQAQRKQKEYEEVIAAFLGRDRARGERRFDEVDYVLRTADMEMQRRVVKRMRAETVLEELADGDEEAASTVTTTVTATSSPNSSGGGTTIQSGDGNVEAEDGKRLQLNDGSQQRVKRRRLRKARTAGDIEEESSSSSSSESESSSSSDSSSSDDDDDRQEMKRPNNPKRKGAEASTSSSSSSSSSSSGEDSESESESESDDSSDDD